MSQQNLKGLKRKLILCKKPDNQNFKPDFYNLSIENDRLNLEELIENTPDLIVHDRMDEQLKELFKIKNAQKRLSANDLEGFLTKWIKENDSIEEYGVWVFYSWKNMLVHILPENEFVELRTSRNQYKLTPQQQKLLSSKTVGVVGLSVGQSVAVTMAMERIFGTIRIADFDVLELSNLNRIRAGVGDLGLLKTTMVAREIAEIDPYLKVEIFDKGLTKDNIEEFIGGSSKLDVLVEECDSFDMKIHSRIVARNHRVPVVMDTSDSGMIDIERFDLNHQTKILHGLTSIDSLEDLYALPDSEKLAAMLGVAGIKDVSLLMKTSLVEVGQSITTWPQLATDVAYGGAVAAQIVRDIMLGKDVKSGRYYSESKGWLVSDDMKILSKTDSWKELEFENVKEAYSISAEQKQDLIQNALKSIIPFSNLSFKVLVKEASYYIVLLLKESEITGESWELDTLSSVYSLLRNMERWGRSNNLEMITEDFPFEDNKSVVARAYFKPFAKELPTDSHFVTKSESGNFVSNLKELGSHFENINLEVLEAQGQKLKLVSDCGYLFRSLILDKTWHENFFSKIAWEDVEENKHSSTIGIEDMDIFPMEKIILEAARDWKVIEPLSEINLGEVFEKYIGKQILESDLCVFVHSSKKNSEVFRKGGKFLEDLRELSLLNSLTVNHIPLICDAFDQLKYFDLKLSSRLEKVMNEILADNKGFLSSHKTKTTWMYMLLIKKKKKENQQKELYQIFSDLV